MPLENRKCAKCHINTEGEDINLRFHRFPLPSGKYGPLRARVWAEFCFPAGAWSTEKSLKSLHQQHLLLCSKNFDDNAYTSSARKRINNFAIPAGTEGILLRLRQEQEGATSNKTVTNIPGPIEMNFQATTTAMIIEKMDQLFDALNGDTPDLKRGKKYLTNLTQRSPHLQYFIEMKRFFQEMRFVIR